MRHRPLTLSFVPPFSVRVFLKECTPYRLLSPPVGGDTMVFVLKYKHHNTPTPEVLRGESIVSAISNNGVHEVPTCTNSVTTGELSRGFAR